MPPKREAQTGVKLTDDEQIILRRLAEDWGLTLSELVRRCIAVGLPVLHDVPFMRRVQLEDCILMRRRQ